jgi:hypothetical protein
MVAMAEAMSGSPLIFLAIDKRNNGGYLGRYGRHRSGAKVTRRHENGSNWSGIARKVKRNRRL